MKQTFVTLALFGLLAASPLFGQSGNGKLLKNRVYLSYEDLNDTLSVKDSTLFVYDIENNLLEETSWQDDFFFQISGAKRYLRTYDNEGNVLTQIEQLLENANWVNYTRENYTYDSNNLLLILNYSTWQNNAWVVGLTVYYSYNLNGQILTILRNTSRSFYTYNDQNKLDTITSQYYANGIWTNNQRSVYSYNSIPGGNTITRLQLIWSGSNWDNFTKRTETFDNNGNLALYIWETWQNGTIWELNTRRSWVYDNNQNPVYLLQEWWTDSAWVNSGQTNFEYDSDADIVFSQTDYWLDDVWAKRNTYHYYYYSPVSTHTPSAANFTIFPNPASTSVTLESEGLTHINLFDQQGRLVRSQGLQGQAQETLQLGNLPTGNYLLQVFGSDGKIGAKSLQIRR